MTRRCKSLVSHFVRVAVINHTRLEKTVSVRPRAQCLAHGGVSFSPASVWEVMGVSVLCLLECMEESSPSSPVQLYGPCTLLRVVPGGRLLGGVKRPVPPVLPGLLASQRGLATSNRQILPCPLYLKGFSGEKQVKEEEKEKDSWSLALTQPRSCSPHSAKR